MLASAERLRHVIETIEQAAKRVGRRPNSVTLIAVSKTVTPDLVTQAIKVGVSDLGENYVQEATKKIEKIRSLEFGKKVRWHLIGSLQTNKSKFVVGKFETIQSVDRFELAQALDKRAQEAGVIQNILIQVKLGDEPTKGGMLVTDVPAMIEKLQTLKNLLLEGVMSIPPIEAEAEGSRKYFAQLCSLKNQWANLLDPAQGSFQHLSMGTSHDFEIAVEEGATMVRVGTAIFGTR